MTTILRIPVHAKTVSPNRQEHWTARHARKRFIVSKLLDAWEELYLARTDYEALMPLEVVLTRYSSHTMDGDNLQGALKSVRDAVAGLLLPNKAPGQADGDNRLSWVYRQAKGAKDQLLIEVNLMLAEDQEANVK